MKSLKFLGIIFAIITAALVLVSCGGAEASAEIVSSSDSAVVISVNETSGSLEDVLESLKADGKIDYSASEGEYGIYIESVNGRAADPSSEYWAIYTSLSELDGVIYSSADFGTYDFEGKTLCSASYGASGLIAVEGELYALVLESWQ